MITKTCSKCGGVECTAGSWVKWDESKKNMPRFCRCADDPLTFAEAMALDPSEVEILYNPVTGWVNVADYENISVRDARSSKFRRSRPKRSRVEEMAGVDDGQVHYGVDVGKRAEFGAAVVRAVCEYVRTIFPGEPMPLEYIKRETNIAIIADSIKIHFLDPQP